MAGVLALAMLVSCEDLLTIDELSNRTVEKGYYTSAQRVEQAVIGGYVDLRRALLANHAWLMYGEVRTGSLRVEQPFYTYVAAQALVQHDRDMAQLADWAYFYDVIRDANRVLVIIDQVADDVLSAYQYNLFRGEALALKSYAYFYIARTWGMAVSAEQGDFGKVMNREAAVERAAGFATEACSLLPWLLLNDDRIESAAVTAVRFNRTAVTNLLAQQYLWLGKNTDAYRITADIAVESRVDSLADFGLSMGRDDRTAVPAVPLGSAVSIAVEKLDALFPEGDRRRESLFRLSADRKQATFVNDARELLMLLPKRELHLLLAEAAWKTDRFEEAKQRLVQAAAGATENYAELTESQFADALLTERKRILIGNGQGLFDLIRFNRVKTAIPVFTDADIAGGAAYWPLAPRSVSDNGVVQHPYWGR